MIGLLCRRLVCGLSARIQIVTVCLLAGVSRTPPLLLLPSQENCQMWSFVKCDLQTPTIPETVYILVVALYILEEEEFCGFSLSTPTVAFVSELWGRCLPERALHFRIPPERALWVHQWVRGGFTQKPVMPQLAITCLSPTQPSTEALFYHHLKHNWATPSLSVDELSGAQLPLSPPLL